MSNNIRVISCPDFVRLDAAGKLDVNATRTCLSEIVAASTAAGVHRALLDVREITGAPSISELFWLADALPTLGLPGLQRLALVYVDHGQGRATFFATAAHNRGINIREFTEFEDAFNWLSDDKPVAD